MTENPATASLQPVRGWGYEERTSRTSDSSFPPIPYGELPLGRVVGCSTVPGEESKAVPDGLSLRFARTDAIRLPANHPDRKPGKRAHRRKTEFLRDTGANKTGFLGVKWSERKQYFEAYIRDHRAGKGRKVYCGGGKTAEEAARAYDRKARELYGDRAVLNFPEAR